MRRDRKAVPTVLFTSNDGVYGPAKHDCGRALRESRQLPGPAEKRPKKARRVLGSFVSDGPWGAFDWASMHARRGRDFVAKFCIEWKYLRFIFNDFETCLFNLKCLQNVFVSSSTSSN